MGYTPQKDTKFSGTETLTNLTINAGGTVDMDAIGNTVLVPTVLSVTSTTDAISAAALISYVSSQLSSYATTAALNTAIAGLDHKASVRLATTGAITLTSRTSTVLTTSASTLTIDGSAVVNGDRVLVKNTPTGGSSTAGDTGIFVVSGVGSTVLLTRTSDATNWSDIPGSMVAVETGTANADKVFICTADAGGTMGTTAQSWTQFGAATASQVANTPAGNIAATDVQAAINELDTEKLDATTASTTYLAKSGGTMSGAIAMGSNKITGLTNASAAGEALSYGQLFTSGTLTLGSGGTGNLSLPGTIAMTGGGTGAVNTIGSNYHEFTSTTASGNKTTIIGASSSSAYMGFGVSGVLDWSITRTAAGEATVSSGDTLKHDTAAAGTSNTVVATTAFVQRDSRRKTVLAVANASMPYTITASSLIPTAEVIIAQQTAAKTTGQGIILPAASAVSAGQIITIKDGSTTGAGTYNLVIDRAGSDTIDGLTTFTLDTNLQSVDLMSDGSSKWYIV